MKYVGVKQNRFFGLHATMQRVPPCECVVIKCAGVKQYGTTLNEEALRLVPYPGPDFSAQKTR